jgi:hypothetical protein
MPRAANVAVLGDVIFSLIFGPGGGAAAHVGDFGAFHNYFSP